MKNKKNIINNFLIILIAVIILAIMILGLLSRNNSKPIVDDEELEVEEKVVISEGTYDRNGDLIVNINDSKGKAYYLEKDRLVVSKFTIQKSATGDIYFHATVKNISNEDIDLEENYSIILYEDNKEVEIFDGSIFGLVAKDTSTMCEVEISSSKINKVLFRKV